MAHTNIVPVIESLAVWIRLACHGTFDPRANFHGLLRWVSNAGLRSVDRIEHHSELNRTDISDGCEARNEVGDQNQDEGNTAERDVPPYPPFNINFRLHKR